MTRLSPAFAWALHPARLSGVLSMFEILRSSKQHDARSPRSVGSRRLFDRISFDSEIRFFFSPRGPVVPSFLFSYCLAVCTGCSRKPIQRLRNPADALKMGIEKRRARLTVVLPADFHTLGIRALGRPPFDLKPRDTAPFGLKRLRGQIHPHDRHTASPPSLTGLYARLLVRLRKVY